MRRALRFLCEMWEPQNPAFQWFPVVMLAVVFLLHGAFMVLCLWLGGADKP